MSNITSTNENVVIGQRLAQLRAKFRLSQSEFAKNLGISLRAYQNYERGEREITAALIRALYERFRVRPVWLLLGEGDDPLREIGEIDPLLAELIAEEFDLIEGADWKKENTSHYPPLMSFAYRLALVYNRIVRKLQPGDSPIDLVSEEVKYLKDLSVREGSPGLRRRPHPEELRHLDSHAIQTDEVYGKHADVTELQREITATVDGKKYIGYYTVKGKRRLSVIVHYGDRLHTDAHIYRPDQLPMIDGIAQHLLWELVTGKVLASTKPLKQRTPKMRHKR